MKNTIVYTVMFIAYLALCTLTAGCAYRIIPEQAAQQVEAVAPVAKEQAAKAQERANTYKAKADAEPQAELKVPWLTAYNEALHAYDFNNFVAGQVDEGMGQSKTVQNFAADAIAPIAQVAQAGTGIPWTEILGAVTVIAGGLGAVKAKQAYSDIPAEIWKWEESICMNPNHGPNGTINYDDPATKASAKMNLSDAAYQRLYPTG